MNKSANQRNGLWITGVVIIVVMGFVITKWNATNTFSSKTNREIALGCTSDGATKFHIHSRVEILINGNITEIPTNIGVTNSCLSALHTHDATGEIHVEAPEQRDFTLADFFAVWGESFSQRQILNYQTDATHNIRMTVNGEDSKEYENLILKDDDEIVIYYEELK